MKMGYASLMVSTVLAMSMAFKASAATAYVDQNSPDPTPPYSTQATAAHDIQDAVDVTTNGDTVLVEPGTYDLTNQVTITNGILLQSANGAGQTIIDAETNSSSWCLWVSNSAAVIDGFTVRCRSEYGYGANLLAGGTVRNCNITNYSVYALGNAIYMTRGILSNSTVSYIGGASGEGSAIYGGDGSVVTGCRILGSRFDGFYETIGIYLVNSELTNSLIIGAQGFATGSEGPPVYAISSSVIDCAITHNASDNSGGAYLDGSFMDRCIVSGNHAYTFGPGTGGGGVFETNSTIRNSLIVSNIADLGAGDGYGAFGGGVYMQGGELVNCTVSGNVAETGTSPAQGGGVYIESGGITNSIIYGNFTGYTPVSNDWFNAGTGVFDHCCTTPNPGGTGNITQDPQFVDPTNGDYHLKSTSPCIDAGVVQPWMAGAQDLDGKPRTVNGTVDMGAYEHPAVSPTPVEILNPEWQSGSFSFSFLTQTNNEYYVQYTDSLTPASWHTFTSFVGNGTMVTVTNQAPANPDSFYRVVAE